MLWVPLCLALQAVHTAPWNDQRFEQLARDRGGTWSPVHLPSDYDGYVDVFEETLGGGRAEALYPIGESNRRYLFSHDEGDTGWLLYERKAGGNAGIVWAVDLAAKNRWEVPKPIGPSVRGTLRRYLAQNGWYVAHPSRLTPAEEASFSGLHAFALVQPSARAEHPLDCTFVPPDGNPVDAPDDVVPGYAITPREKRALRGTR